MVALFKAINNLVEVATEHPEYDIGVLKDLSQVLVFHELTAESGEPLVHLSVDLSHGLEGAASSGLEAVFKIIHVGFTRRDLNFLSLPL